MSLDQPNHWSGSVSSLNDASCGMDNAEDGRQRSWGTVVQAAGQTLPLGVCFGVTLMCCFCNALPARTWCSLLLAYLSEIYNFYMFLENLNLEKRNQVFPWIIHWHYPLGASTTNSLPSYLNLLTFWGGEPGFRECTTHSVIATF